MNRYGELSPEIVDDAHRVLARLGYPVDGTIEEKTRWAIEQLKQSDVPIYVYAAAPEGHSG